MSTDNTIRRRTFLAVTLAAAGSAGTACGFGDDDGNTGDDGNGGENGNGGDQPQSGGTLRQSMLPVAQYDPAVGGNSSFGQIMMSGLWEGLVVYDVDDPLQAAPGVAESWDISDDLLTYTFHLRSDAKWSNGDPVTAQDLEWNWQRILTPGIAGEGNPSYNPSLSSALGVVGAGAYQSGETENFDEVGVKALDDTTLEITVEAPNPDFLIYLAGHWGFPLHPATVEEHDDGWADPQNWVSNGAYVLDEFRVNQGAVLLPNDQYWDKENYHLDRWEITFNDAGTVADLLSYQNDDIDITGRIEDDLEAVTTSNVASELISSPTNQYRNLAVMNSHNLALHDVRVRQALSMAIDREALATVAVPSVAGNSLIPSAVDGYDQVPGVEDDIEGALALLEDAGYPNGEGLPTIQLLDFQPSPWVEAIAEMWRENLNIDVSLDIVELGVWREKRNQLHPEDYTGFSVANQAVNPPTLLAFVRPTSTIGPSIGGLGLALPDVAEDVVTALDDGAPPAEAAQILEGNRHPEVEEVYSKAQEAVAAADPDTQQALLIEAATAANEAYVKIPVLWGGYNLLVKPRVKNLRPWFYANVFTTKGVTIEE